MWQLIINGPGYFDTAYELPDGETLLGRADENDVILSGDQVSRRHARLYFEGGALYFEDLGSRNGTRVNGGFLVEGHRVEDGDVFTIGENTLTVRQPSDFEVAKTELLAEDDPLRASLPEQPFGEVLVSRSIEDNPFLEDINLLDNFSVQDFEMLPFLDNFGSSVGGAPMASRPVQGSRQDGEVKGGKAPGREELLLFAQVSEKLNSAASLDAFLDEVMALIVEVSHATTGAALMFDDQGKLSPAIVRNISGQVPEDVPISRSIIGEVVRKKVALAVINAQDDAHFSNSESVIMYGLEQVICAPMLKGDELLGVIYLNRPAKPTKSMPLSRLVDIVNALAHMLASGVEKWASRARAPAEAQRQQRLECFHAPAAVERLAREGGLELGKLEERCVTAMSVELSDLAQLCQAPPAEEIAALLCDYRALVRRLVFEFEGTLVQFVGAGALAVFGAPFSTGDDGARAIRCALSCRRECAALLGQRLAPRHGCGVKIALSTGKALVGHVGSAAHCDYAVLGNCVVLAARLQAMGRADAILATDDAIKAATAHFPVHPVGVFEQRDRPHKIRIYEVMEADAAGAVDEVSSAPEPMVTKRQRLFAPKHGGEDGAGEAPAAAEPARVPSRPLPRGVPAARSRPPAASAAESADRQGTAGQSNAPRPALRSIPPLPRVPARFSARASGGSTEAPRPAIRPSLPPLPLAKKSGGSSVSTVVASLPDLLQGAAGAATPGRDEAPPSVRPRAAKAPRAPARPAKGSRRPQE